MYFLFYQNLSWVELEGVYVTSAWLSWPLKAKFLLSKDSFYNCAPWLEFHYCAITGFRVMEGALDLEFPTTGSFKISQLRHLPTPGEVVCKVPEGIQTSLALRSRPTMAHQEIEAIENERQI